MGLSLYNLFKVRLTVLNWHREKRSSVSWSRSCSFDDSHHCFFELLSHFQVGLLLANSLLILNRQRFLSKYGLDDMSGMNANNPLKAQMVSLLFAMQYLKPVVIVANFVTILFELILGGSWREGTNKTKHKKALRLPTIWYTTEIF